jgi:hypothetical protein
MTNRHLDPHSGSRTFFAGGVSLHNAELAARLATKWFDKVELEVGPTGEKYSWSVDVGSVATGGANVTMSIEPSPWGQDGPYRPDLARVILDWAVAGDPEQLPDPANYLLNF